MASNGIVIREATKEDHPTFARLFLELAVDDPVLSVERFEVEMVKTSLIAEKDGKAIGYAHFRPAREVAHLSHIVSAPEARRTGVGRALMHAVIDRARDLGCVMLSLNVRPENAAAISLYESFGLTRAFLSRAVQIDWSSIDALAAERTPFAHLAKEIDARGDEDDRLERLARVSRGLLADQRVRPNRVLLMIESSPNIIALTVFDQEFPGAYPLRAPDGPHALSLLRALRPYARVQDTFINVMVEDQSSVADALLEVGARMRMEAIHMRGAINELGARNT